MKYDPIISEQMKHLPTGCLTVLTEDILRQPPPHHHHPPPFQLQKPAPHPHPSPRTSLQIIMGCGQLSRVRTEPSGGWTPNNAESSVTRVSSTGNNLNFCRRVRPFLKLRYWFRRKVDAQKALHWQRGKENPGEEKMKRTKKCNSLFVVFVLGLTVLVATLLGIGLKLKLRLCRTIHFWKATKENKLAGRARVWQRIPYVRIFEDSLLL